MEAARGRSARLAAAERAAAEAVSLEDLAAEGLGPIQEAVGASNVLLYRYDERGVVRGVAGSLASAIPTYAAELFVEDPVQRHLMAVDPKARPVVVLRELEPREYLRSGAYQEFYRPHDVHHLLGLWLTDLPYGAPGMTGILFTRAEREADFSKDDARALARALPSFQAAARRFDRLDRDRREIRGVLAAFAPGARLALSRDARLLWISPEAEALLGPSLARGQLPTALRDAALRLLLVARSELADAAPPFQVDLGLVERRVSAELQLSRGPTGDAVVAVTLRERGDGNVASAFLHKLAVRHGLTNAERTVLACLGEGLSNREIGDRLHVSRETVKTHVQRVLAKLDVASRTQAALRLQSG